ncbi:hypothetical protein V493_04760 [Pseudogymnoascus sp. VKM F-4281 (FW-2241)]|nr:hypothetical protein V493_04760 [Pseudogymnoascus sp. VKM F-4281 (FW-2241)]
MRFSLALIAVAAATSVAAQDVAGIVSQIPSCALTCIATASAGQSCGITDYKCQCGKISAIQASATPCVTSKCKPDEALKVLSLTGALCKAVGGGSSGSSSAAAGADSGEATTQAAGGAAAIPTTNASFATSTNDGTVEPSLPATTSVSGSGPNDQPTGAFTETPRPVETGAASRMGGGGAAAAVVAVAAMLL